MFPPDSPDRVIRAVLEVLVRKDICSSVGVKAWQEYVTLWTQTRSNSGLEVLTKSLLGTHVEKQVTRSEAWKGDLV